jgi:hypothetical protein
MPVTLTEKEAIKIGILSSERRRYFKLMGAKSNLAPRGSDPPLYCLHGIDLQNAEPPIYPFGDNVQAVTRVQLPIQNSAGGSTGLEKIRQAIMELVDRGKMIDGKPYPSPGPTTLANSSQTPLQRHKPTPRRANGTPVTSKPSSRR